MTTEVSAPPAARLHVLVTGIGLLGPGLNSWAEAQALLAQPSHWVHSPTTVPAPQRLPATERRRAGAVVKASIVVADEALAGSGLDPAGLPTVFTSSTGEPSNCHLLCEALATVDRMVSPTRFTNSVHNAAAGYWHIATQSRAPSTSLAAFDASFAAGLLEAAVQCHATGAPVLLVAADVPYPEPLHAKRPVADVFAVALLLAPGTTGGGRSLSLRTTAAGNPANDKLLTTCAHPGLANVATGIPAARALPLLQALASPAASTVVLDALPGLLLQADVAALGLAPSTPAQP
jgi:Beta-ketoacyl synthase, N-terminal domain